MPRLRILAGPSPSNLKEIHANTGEGVDVSSSAFEGKVAVYIKDFADPSGKVSDSAYFQREGRKDVTWSIQFQGEYASLAVARAETDVRRWSLNGAGRFLQTHSANDILFGNVFDHPLPIPWGFSTILGFMQ